MDLARLDVTWLLLQAAVLLIALSIHESAHAWAADRLGDPTARRLGRVTLNPLVHIDLVGTVIFPLVSMLAGGLIFGWAKPVPVVPANLRNPRSGHALVAAAGPASNIVLALSSLVLFNAIQSTLDPRTIGQSGFLYPGLKMLEFSLLINVLLAVFNLFPIPPLDGSWILSALLPGSMARLFEQIRPYGFMILILALYSGVLFRFLNPVLAFVRRLVL